MNESELYAFVQEAKFQGGKGTYKVRAGDRMKILMAEAERQGADVVDLRKRMGYVDLLWDGASVRLLP
jgi:hypothetical protein